MKNIVIKLNFRKKINSIDYKLEYHLTTIEIETMNLELLYAILDFYSYYCDDDDLDFVVENENKVVFTDYRSIRNFTENFKIEHIEEIQNGIIEKLEKFIKLYKESDYKQVILSIPYNH